MKKEIEGYLVNKVEKLGGQEYNHIGCEEAGFEDMVNSFVPSIGDKRRVRITIESLDD